MLMRSIRRSSICALWGAAIGASLVTGPTTALSAGAEEFYKGKTISLIIGYGVGGGYDLYGRLLARHMGKYIPGRPTIVPQNLTGAGSLRAAIGSLRVKTHGPTVNLMRSMSWWRRFGAPRIECLIRA
jgi:tripartite-type tricarboxylate transporter receptor subunit TctC